MRLLLAGITCFFLTVFLYSNNYLKSYLDTEDGVLEANWISHNSLSGHEYAVIHFRNKIKIEEVPEKLNLFISADNRYKLYINGKYVCNGPARGDLLHWRYDSIDVSSYLKSGDNIFAAIVWNQGDNAHVAQYSVKTGFLLWTDNKGYKNSINTLKGNWKVHRNQAYSPYLKSFPGYYAAGACDKVNGNKYPWGWRLNNYDDSKWIDAVVNGRATNIDFMYLKKRVLRPRTIPFMERKQEPDLIIRKTDLDKLKEGKKFEGDVIIPANFSGKILLDQRYLTIGYPELEVSGGKNAEIEVIYAEALFDSITNNGKRGYKSNRNEVDNKIMTGITDVFITDGGKNRLFKPLWKRTWRYVEVNISTKEEPLTINKFEGMFAAYPFEKQAFFTSNNNLHEEIFNIGWRTARLCAAETYYDCPYYEQLQYVGDTRIQALISLYVSGDERLMKNAISLFDYSRTSEGLTFSRYPSNYPQIIPVFSLLWTKMVYDYYMHVDDPDFVEEMLPGIGAVLNWFEARIDSTGLLKENEYWNFVDWAHEHTRGVPHGVEKSYSSLMNLHLVDALQTASFLYKEFGKRCGAERYDSLSKDISHNIMNVFYNEEKGLIAAEPSQNVFGQHSNIMGVITNTLPESNYKEVVNKLLKDSSLIEGSIYYKFYLFRALKAAGLADLYTDNLNDWKTMLDMGLTTFAEDLLDMRSDCHAWSASPCYDFLATVAGITPVEPGFKSVDIKPSLGNLKNIEAKMPHDKGIIELDLKRRGKYGIAGKVHIPEGLNATFIWGDKEELLHSGENKIFIKADLQSYE